MPKVMVMMARCGNCERYFRSFSHVTIEFTPNIENAYVDVLAAKKKLTEVLNSSLRGRKKAAWYPMLSTVLRTAMTSLACWSHRTQSKAKQSTPAADGLAAAVCSTRAVTRTQHGAARIAVELEAVFLEVLVH